MLPGQTLRTSSWWEGDRVIFQTSVAETGATCLAGGWVQLRAAEASSKL